MLAAVPACSSEKKQPPAAAPAPTFTGEAFLYGTVGSMARMTGYEPLLVSQYGLVVDLKGTGSSDVPAYLRQRFLIEMSRKGMGSARMGTQDLSPSRVLESMNTAVVAVEGLIPPGATRGTRFDVLVNALPQTQTTSLVGGRLYTTELSVDGINPAMQFSRQMAMAGGQTYRSPLGDEIVDEERFELNRQAVILSGGVVTTERVLQLRLNQPSWTRSRLIADRINERFRKGRGDRDETAVAKTDMTVDIHVPSRFAQQPERLLALIQHLYVQRGYNFELEQGKRIGEVLVQQPSYAERIALTWEALGKTALPAIQSYYEHADNSVRLAALEAGVRLEDNTAFEHLRHLAGLDDIRLRRHAAALLVHLPRHTGGPAVLRRLLNDPDQSVQIGAYQSLSQIAEPLLMHRVQMGEGMQFSFMLDIVESQRPLVYITQSELPRIAVFNSYVGFRTPMVMSLWDSRLMIKAMDDTSPMEVYYRENDESEGEVHKLLPTVGNLVFLLAHKENSRNRTPGLGLSYSEVVDVLYQLVKKDKIRAPIEFEENALARRIAEARVLVAQAPQRPDTAGQPGRSTDADADAGGAGGIEWERPLGGRPEISDRPDVGAVPLP